MRTVFTTIAFISLFASSLFANFFNIDKTNQSMNCKKIEQTDWVKQHKELLQKLKTHTVDKIVLNFAQVVLNRVRGISPYERTIVLDKASIPIFLKLFQDGLMLPTKWTLPPKVELSDTEPLFFICLTFYDNEKEIARVSLTDIKLKKNEEYWYYTMDANCLRELHSLINKILKENNISFTFRQEESCTVPTSDIAPHYSANY